MKITTTFVCGDCGKKIEGKGTPVLRETPEGFKVRKQVCPKCLYGVQPVSKRQLNAIGG